MLTSFRTRCSESASHNRVAMSPPMECPMTDSLSRVKPTTCSMAFNVFHSLVMCASRERSSAWELRP